MISRYVTCDYCGGICEGVWYQIYQNEGDYFTGKVTNKHEVCDKCFNKMLESLEEGEKE